MSDDTKDTQDPDPMRFLIPQNLENAGLRAVDFAMRSYQSYILLAQVGNWEQFKIAKKLATREGAYDKAKVYAMNEESFDRALDNPEIYTSALAGDA